MFGLDKISFLICLGVTLLLTGLIIFFMRQKFAVYDRHITEQSQLLKHLVAKLENNIHTTNAMLAAPSAIAAAKEAHKQFGQNGGHVLSNSKIIVSDDEDEDEDEDEDTSEESDDATSSTSDDDSEVSDIDADNLNVQSKQIKIKLDELTYGNKCSDEHHISLNDIDNVGETKTINLNTLDDLDVDENSDMNTDTDEDDDDDDNDDDEDDDRSSEKLTITRTEAKLTVYHVNDDNANDVREINELNSTEQHYSDASLNNVPSLKQILLDEDSEIRISNGKNKNNNKYNDMNDSKDNQYLEFLETNDDMLNLNDMKLSQLKELCKGHNLSTNGNKKELIERLTNK
jgi:hypothetical protein